MTEPIHLKAGQIAAVRTQMLKDQKGLCALCGLKVPDGAAVLDHCHSSGFVRGVLHRACNSLLGKLENNRKRYGLGNDRDFAAFMAGVVQYLHSSHLKYNLLHPTFKTPEQKRLARNAAARKRRAAAKKG